MKHWSLVMKVLICYDYKALMTSLISLFDCSFCIVFTVYMKENCIKIIYVVSKNWRPSKTADVHAELSVFCSLMPYSSENQLTES